MDALGGGYCNGAVVGSPKPGKAGDGILVEFDAGRGPDAVVVLQIPARVGCRGQTKVEQ